MGHSRIGTLPTTKRWTDVITLIAGGGDVSRIAAKTAEAANDSLAKASRSLALKKAIFLLARIPLAAKEVDFPDQLRALGLDVGDQPTLTEICAAITMYLDAEMQGRRRDDFGEIAQVALVESFTAIGAPLLPSLTGLTDPADDTRVALKSLSSVKQFGILARDYFARLVRRCLDYFLSRELPNHVGISKRFHSVREHIEFLNAIELHCREAAVIVQEFAGGWLSKTAYESEVDEEASSRFAHHAFTKITRELAIRSELGRA